MMRAFLVFCWVVAGLGFAGCGVADQAVHKTAHVVKHGEQKVEKHL